MQNVVWRADGARLSYFGYETLFDLKPDGTDRRALLDGNGYYSAQGWSPDGRYLALKIGRVNMHTRSSAVALLPQDGGELKYPGSIIGRTAWSPDGRQLAYTDTGSPYDAFPDAERKAVAGLYAVNIDTGDRTRLTESGSARDIDPAWFSDGRHIAFLRGSARADGDLYVLATDHGRLVRHATGVREFAVSPDGSRLAWTTRTGLFASSLDASSTRRLAGQDAQSLTWSPDGTRIAYSGWDATLSERDIYTVDVLERRVRRLTMTAADETDVTWRPD